MNTSYSLQQLGWQAFFQQQLSLEELENCSCGRISAHHRNAYIVQLESSTVELLITHTLPSMTVGDWVLFDNDGQFVRLLERKSLISRKAAGTSLYEQLIASNVDTLFIVCSLNNDFNLNRIERYLSIAHDTQMDPVVVLTKRDLTPNWEELAEQVQSLDKFLSVEAVNALDADSIKPLMQWCKAGKTVSFVGSSGVGKSTLVNTLMGEDVQETQGIREDDSKGRHTTTSRSMHFMPSGVVLLDTPGMRELQLLDCEDGLHQTFAEIEQLQNACRYSDCSHKNEPGCAVRKAIENGSLDPRRLDNFQKLRDEQHRNGESFKQRKDKDKALTKQYRHVQSDMRKMKKGY